MPAVTVPQAIAAALQHFQAGRLADSEALCRQILAVQTQHAGALHLLGVIAQQTGDHRRATEFIRQSIASYPGNPGAWFHLGEAQRNLGLLDEAEAAFLQAIQFQPNFADAHLSLGLVLHAQGRSAEALAAYRRAIQSNTESAEAHNNLGVALVQTGCIDEAIAAFRCALALKPDYAAAHNNLGGALNDQGHLSDAVAAYCRALEIDPVYAGAHNNLGNALMELGRVDDSIRALERALELNPKDEDARANYSLLLLRCGDFERGLPLYESRWNQIRSAQRKFSQPMWDGRSAEGLRLLIHAEQGYGDSIQFIRYAAHAANRGCHVIVECQQTLVDLFRGVKGVCEIVVAGHPLPEFDFHVPMMSQPLAFNTRLENLPREIPYIFADPIRRDAWRKRLGGGRSHTKIGLSWAGNSQLRRNRKRHLSLEMLLPLWRVKGVEFYSLQMGNGLEQVPEFSGAAGLIDHTTHIRDFADTAALMAELDLIISVDTAVAHLAGALGLSVWTLLPYVSDWRWGLDREDTPWYPTMRLFRQPSIGDWNSVIERVAHGLELATATGAELRSRLGLEQDRPQFGSSA